MQPIPDTFGGRRRLASHYDEPLLFEAQLLRVLPPKTKREKREQQPGEKPVVPYKLPAPPSPFTNLLGNSS